MSRGTVAGAMPTTPPEAIGELRRQAQATFGVVLTARQTSAFGIYLEELRRWNALHNLTAIDEPQQIVVRHFLDSLTVLPLLGPTAGRALVDVGTGAGFPGVPLRIVADDLRLTLVEATAKKADFCRHLVQALGLTGVTVVHARAEELGRLDEHRQAYDLGTARAVASLPAVLEYLLPLLRVGGRALAQRGEQAPAEVQQAGRALDLLGGRLVQIHRVEVPGIADHRFVVEIEKRAATPAPYPRRAGIPAKRPLL